MERFQAKPIPVRSGKTRQSKNMGHFQVKHARGPDPRVDTGSHRENATKQKHRGRSIALSQSAEDVVDLEACQLVRENAPSIPGGHRRRAVHLTPHG
jgi:hypothetical protein